MVGRAPVSDGRMAVYLSAGVTYGATPIILRLLADAREARIRRASAPGAGGGK